MRLAACICHRVGLDFVAGIGDRVGVIGVGIEVEVEIGVGMESEVRVGVVVAVEVVVRDSEVVGSERL